MKRARPVISAALFTLTGLIALLPILALAGTFQNVLSGQVTAEIDLRNVLADCGTLEVGKVYYWAGKGSSIEANIDGPTPGVSEIMEANVSCVLTVTYDGSGVRAYDPATGDDIGWFPSANRQAVTLFFDRDTQFGNMNEVELTQGDESTIVADAVEPLPGSSMLYLAIRVDSFGHARHSGEWQIPIQIIARPG